MSFLYHVLATAGFVTGALLVGAGALHLVPKFQGPTKRLSAAICRAPGLDWVVTYFTILPLILGPLIAGWAGIFGAVVGQIVGVIVWTHLHEWTHPQATQGHRIVKVINRLIGPWRNHAALWLTMTVVPIFWSIRMVEILAYPLLARLVGFPRYIQRDWVNVSRHKFQGLVGHDLIWCLYCDWMTGVWSLGTEILRNVESFWCPIRFLDNKKCDNCAIDFPDVNHGWVEHNATMRHVTDVLDQMHSNGFRGWFGHPVRLTVKGESLPDETVPAVSHGDGTAGGN